MELRIFFLECMCGGDWNVFLNERKELEKEKETRRKGSLMEHCAEEGNVRGKGGNKLTTLSEIGGKDKNRFRCR